MGASVDVAGANELFQLGMELGVLLRRGDIPLRVERQFDRLIAGGELARV